ncbi:hypothetical protein HCN44_000538 [Aphidius gifuensis]|uniref:RRM domain-containing protein n=1 Tax=Aphidius gifuensis TaxID=684658 RepID=A0A834XNU6_APHGI|nr:eukaryotic translation initiation factor 3 subunit G-2-like [Aphidius gifuensis]KAF7990733.1 hypothetical protein HCN44_000538 [Aphidius gifuensis]
MEQRESKNWRFDISMSENDPERDKKKLQNKLNDLKKSIDKKKEKGLDYLPSKITDKSGITNKKIPSEKLIRITKTELKERVEPSGHDGVAATTDSDGKIQGGKYIPPSLRGGYIKSDDNRRTIRISSLIESTSETDLEEMVKPFGDVQKLYLAKNQLTDKCKGFADVRFKYHADAREAIAYLNGYRYDYLILSVEWSPIN